MNGFKVYKSIDEAYYFSKVLNPVDFKNTYYLFADSKKQAGFSKTKKCYFISLITIAHDIKTDTFSFDTTYLINHHGNIEEMDSKTNLNIVACYHALPNGQVYEYIGDYINNKEKIYHNIILKRTSIEYDTQFPES